MLAIPLLLLTVFAPGLYAGGEQGSWVELRKGSRLFEHLSSRAVRCHELRRNGATVHSQGVEVNANYFQMLGVKAARGQFFDGRQGNFAVLSHELWRTQFGSDPALVGSRVTLDGKCYTILGIAEPGFRGHEFNQRTDLWILANPRS